MKPPISVRVQNISAINKAIEKYGQELATKIDRLVQGVATNALTDVRNQIQNTPKTGAIYRRGNITHQASAPNQAPALDTSFLFNSLYYEQPRKLSAEIGSRLPYSYYLEHGTIHMKPRPSWIHAAKRAEITLNEKITEAIQKAATR